jgi:hypothetical protein
MKLVGKAAVFERVSRKGTAGEPCAACRPYGARACGGQPQAATPPHGTASASRGGTDFSGIRVRAGAHSPAECVQAKLAARAVDDPLEHEADRVAEETTRTPGAVAALTGTPPKISRRRPVAEGTGASQDARVPESVSRVLGGAGRALEPALRRNLSRRFGHDFADVRVHSGAAAEDSARELGAQAYTVGPHIVFGAGRFAPGAEEGRRLIAHELAHVVQQRGGSSIGAPQRKVVLKGTELEDRDSFIKAHKWSNAARARSVMEDMAAAADVFDFANDQELKMEIDKRLSTVAHMEESQVTSPMHEKSFAYPFSESNATELYGPRVNYAARDAWEPAVSDGYADRNTKANKKKNNDLSHAARSKRYLYYGDQAPGYGWKLSAKGKLDPYRAVSLLFTPQVLPRRRSLIHCDYLISLVNMLSLADAIGRAKFNERVKNFGLDNFVLKWNAFQDLHLETKVRGADGEFLTVNGVELPKTGLASTQRVRPSSPADLVIGDHVVFLNHYAYDPLNAAVGNAWRLENAVLVARGSKGNPDRDEFLGHGSGRRNAVAMRATLAGEFHKVYREAAALIGDTKSKDKRTQARASYKLSVRFPNIAQTGTGFRIRGMSWCAYIDEPFEKFKAVEGKDVIGLKDPCFPNQMGTVERPIESAR